MATGLSIGLFFLLLFLLSLGIWVAPALIAIGYVLLEFFTPAPVGSLLASTIWDASWNWALTALPLFIWMGEILFRTRLSSIGDSCDCIGSGSGGSSTRGITGSEQELNINSPRISDRTRTDVDR